ncbi:hypothetical protein HUW46_03491 [Amycolatopsis sp. CA-230715]|nr:hypothetical protein HUW46_03491 [Amycolatopsis sp. CA-230715]
MILPSEPVRILALSSNLRKIKEEVVEVLNE